MSLLCAVLQAGTEDKVALAELQAVLQRHYQTLYSTFMYYACGGTGDVFHMGLNNFTSWLEACKVGMAELQMC